VEEMENKMRNTLNEIYFGKTMDIVNDLRLVFLWVPIFSVKGTFNYHMASKGVCSNHQSAVIWGEGVDQIVIYLF